MIILQDPRTDETLYSVLARTLASLASVPPLRFRKSVFGSKRIAAAATFPNHLRQLVDVAQPWGLLTSDFVIDMLTAYPFYAAFWTVERQTAMRRYMLADSGVARPPAAVGRCHAHRKQRLYCCPGCMEDDRATYGEAHFRRVHQLDSVWWCPQHETFLEATGIETHEQALTAKTYVTLEEAVLQGTCSTWATACTGTAAMLLQTLARDSGWVLYQTRVPMTIGELPQRVKESLSSAGYVTQQGIVRSEQLFDDMERLAGPQLLNSLGCSLAREQKGTWLHRVVRPGAVLHPTCTLLVLALLSMSPAHFFSPEPLPPPASPSSSAPPYPCLNSAAPHARQLVIYRPPVPTTRRTGMLYTCELCGYQYYVGHGQGFETASPRNFGPVWEAALRQLAADPTVTQRQAMTTLGLRSVATLNNASRHYGIGRWEAPALSAGTSGQGIRWPAPEQNAALLTARLHTSRSQLLAFSADHPTSTRTEIEGQLPSAYRFVMTHDPVWMAEHLPAPQSRRVPRRNAPHQVTDLDDQLAEQVKQVAHTLREQRRPAIRVTQHALLRRLDHRVHHGVEHRFPKLAQAVANEIDDDLQYYRRRMLDLQENRQHYGQPITPQLLLRAAPKSKRTAALLQVACQVISDVITV